MTASLKTLPVARLKYRMIVQKINIYVRYEKLGK